MPKYKKQHYVPRFYLKRFSYDERKVNIWNLQRKKTIYSANLKSQCYEDYFYAKEPEVEKVLGETIECATAKILESIEMHSILPEPLSDEHYAILIYILTQYGRTKYAADSLNEMNDKLMRHINRGKASAEGIDIDQYQSFIQSAPLISLGITIQGYPLLLDLNYKLLVNETKVDFVTSDNPVVFYNQLFSFRENMSCTGVLTRGLQIFLPIDPVNVLVFYDPWIYSVERTRRRIVEVTLEKDVHEINTLQMCSALNCVYFRDKALDINLLYQKASPFLRQTKNNMNVIQEKGTKNGKEEVIKVSREDIRTNLSLSFLRLKTRAKVWKWFFQKQRLQPVTVLRNKRLHKIYEEFRGCVKNGEYEIGNFPQYLLDKDIVILK